MSFDHPAQKDDIAKIVDRIRELLVAAKDRSQGYSFNISYGMRELPPIRNSLGDLFAEYDLDGSCEIRIKIEPRELDIADWQSIRDQLNALGDDLRYRKTESCAKV